MDPNTITALAVTVLALAAVIGGWIYLRRYLRDSTDAEMVGFVRMLVRAAEQQFLDNEARRAWAIAEAKKRFPAMPLDILIAVLEAAVYDLNQDQTETQIAAAAMGAPMARTWTEAA